jgi:hypothetical protein
MKKKTVCDIIFYLIIPLFIWNGLRKELGDYYTMLLTSLPGFIYTTYFFFKDRTYNITGIFILVSLFAGRILDIISGSAERILWNDIYINIAYTLFWIATIIIRKPMGMYFFVDYASVQGFERENTIKLYRTKELFRYFEYFTALFAIKGIESIILKSWSIKTFGVDGFNQISIIMSVNGYIFTAITIAFILFIVKKIKNVTQNNGVSNVNSISNNLEE